MLLAAILTVYATRNVVVGPDIQTILTCGLFGATLSVAISALVAWIAQVRSPAAARAAARLTLLALLAAFFWYSGWLPNFALPGTAISTAIAFLFLFLRKRSA
jgi:hypothetical protein